MINKEKALHQIDEIYKIIDNNLKAVISGPLIITIGLLIMAIPSIELLFNITIDPFLAHISPIFANMLFFTIRTLFYSCFFALIIQYFKNQHQEPNLIIEKFFSIRKFLPVIVTFVAASLFATAYETLIIPITSIVIGCCIFVLYNHLSFDKFSNLIFLLAASFIETGIIGICLSKSEIPYLWIYLMLYEGFILVSIGLVIYYQRHRN